MKVLLVNASDSKGGAAVVSHRLLNALNKQPGVEAKMLVTEKTTDDKDVLSLKRTWWIKKALDRVVVWAANRFSKKNLWLTDGGFFGNNITRLPEFKEADVIHLHWVNQGFLGLRDLEKILHSGKKIVWTMHDMWVSTALCHHAGTCMQFREDGCQRCEQLQNNECLTQRVWSRKAALYRNANLHLVPCSTWMGESAKASKLTSHLPITIIPNPIELPNILEREQRKDKHIVLFSAARIDLDIKGFDDFLAALQHLSHRKDIEVVLVGGINDTTLLHRIPLPYRYLGYQRDMLSIYAQADCVINCSRYETLPTTIVEAQSVGTTPVAYCHSGARDLIEDGVTGYFADYRDTRSLAKAIERAIDSPIDASALRKHIQEHYNPDVIARRYLTVYCNDNI